MSYQQQFHRWLHSDALSPEEKAQLQAIADDPKEVEDRFFGLLEFGTAGLRLSLIHISPGRSQSPTWG